MAIASTCRIHPTALIGPEVELADHVEVGAYSVIEGPVSIGPGCIIRSHVLLCGPLTMGRDNQVYSGSILGESPQHLKYNGEPTRVEIGDGNVFREHVTIHRGTTHSWVTRIGNQNFLMANSHIGHDSIVGNRCIIANGALVGGHCILADNAYLSGNCAVHQFVRIGRLALLSGCSGTTKDIPPFLIQQGLDTVCGVNKVGMKRAGMNYDQINAVGLAYHILFREGLVLPAALARLEQQLGAIDAIQEMITFLRQCARGINPTRSRGREAA
jgi:UDP-N-acetylglucosamine acyltransferase